jgi:hypothetical protein
MICTVRCFFTDYQPVPGSPHPPREKCIPDPRFLAFIVISAKCTERAVRDLTRNARSVARYPDDVEASETESSLAALFSIGPYTKMAVGTLKIDHLVSSLSHDKTTSR